MCKSGKQKRKAWPTVLGLFLVLGMLGSCMEPSSSDPQKPSAQPTQIVATAEPAAEPTEQPVSIASPAPAATVNPTGEFSVRFIDVGQADAALISCDGEHMLIDGGNREDSSLLYSLLEREGITHLKYVVGTHAHEDHIGGIPGALQRASAEVVFCPVTEYDSKAFDNFKKAAEANGGIVIPSVGDSYDLGSASFTIVGVNSNPSDTNNTSIVLRLVYGDTSFLFTGDAEREAEQTILDSGYILKSDVLKVGHHGSDTSTTYPFLREVMPKYAVISCGVDNKYGHPHEGPLSKLRDADVEVFRTDLQGDILCTSDGTTLTWATEKNRDADTSITAGGAAETMVQPQSVVTPEPASAVESSGETYIGNINSKKVHHSSCSSLPKEKNRVYFDNLDDALNQGYVRCKRCF